MKKKRWRYYLLELFVVFFGVTAAFLLSNSQENRKNAALENNYLQSISLDLLQDREILSEILEINIEHSRMLKKFLLNPGDDWSVDSTSAVVANSMYVASFQGKSSTYESMKYSGHLSLVRDFDLRGLIVDYYESFSTVRLADELEFWWTTENLTPYYMDHFDMRHFRFIDLETSNSVSFINRIQGVLVLLMQKIEAYEELLEKNEELLLKLT